MANHPPKPVTKESLHGELSSLLTTTHGEIRDAAEEITHALEELIRQENAKNRELFEAVVQQAMVLPHSSHFQLADAKVREALIDMLNQAKELLNSGLDNLIEANQKIKEDKKKLKERIKEIEKESRQGPRFTR